MSRSKAPGVSGSDHRRVSSLRLKGVGYGAAAAAVLGAFLIWAPLAGATSPPVTLTAPYAHGSFYNLNKSPITATGCGERASNGVAPKWSASTGIGKVAMKTTAITCTGTGANGSFAGVAISAPMFRAIVPLPLTGNQTSVAAKWSITIAGTESLSVSGSCPTPVLNASGDGSDHCVAAAGWSVSLQSELVDKTTGFAIHDHANAATERSNAADVYSNQSCVASVCTTTNFSAGGTGGAWSGTFNGTFFMNGTFHTANSYVLWLTISLSSYGGYTDTYSSLGVTGSFPVVHAYAHVDMARSGDQMDLVSVVLS